MAVCVEIYKNLHQVILKAICRSSLHLYTYMLCWIERNLRIETHLIFVSFVFFFLLFFNLLYQNML